MDEPLKRCRGCERYKPLTEFYKQKDGQFGRRAKCKSCFKKFSNSYTKKRTELQNNTSNTLTNKEKERIMEECNYSCMLTGANKEVDLDHFIPLNLGDIVFEYGIGGTTYENMIPLTSSLNKSKGAQNPFTWFEKAKFKFNLDSNNWNKALDYMAKKNKMTRSEYKNRINACFIHFGIKKWVESLNYAVINSHNPKASFYKAIEEGINIKVAVMRYGTDASKKFVIKEKEMIRRLQESKK
ncbi:hypothetical protein M3226_05215 [Neobacillus cucumis]|uniref:hypothetical protein n=1 Tax=Neobacillus cucumis TaxID=1740721 RepID=UPI002040CBA6|nr:hypothetical protein [Neobacillus cucumis]MCM3725097.1 hypothetical protein [Neobacillus cucumis]